MIKKRLHRAKVVLLMLSVISVMGMTACSFEPEKETAQEDTVEPETTEEETTETETMKTEEEKTEIETTAAEGAGTNESEILAYIIDLDANKISIDEVEWVTVPSSRADELGEEDGPSGFYIYNPDILTEQFTISEDCMITVLDWQNSFEPQTISGDDFIAVLILKEREEQNDFIPYSIKVTNSTIIEISENYVP